MGSSSDAGYDRTEYGLKRNDGKLWAVGVLGKATIPHIVTLLSVLEMSSEAK
jgi:hypothetical protein